MKGYSTTNLILKDNYYLRIAFPFQEPKNQQIYYEEDLKILIDNQVSKDYQLKEKIAFPLAHNQKDQDV